MYTLSLSSDFEALVNPETTRKLFYTIKFGRRRRPLDFQGTSPGPPLSNLRRPLR